MKKIIFIVPYFGVLPSNFQIWLNSCAKNNTIDWLIFTNDTRKYLCPPNVKINYCEFSDIQKRIQENYDFEVKINSYWHLSLFKPAYGEIFQDYIKDYDFWGHCDMDLLWGDIRHFITEYLLNTYEKIGFQGHSTLYKNTDEVNSRYKTIIPNHINYIDVFSGNTRFSFDEVGMEDIYNYLNIPYYKETNFAHLSKYSYSFYIKYLPEKDNYKNRRQVFVWENGRLFRYYLNKNKQIKKDEFMYVHFFCRPIKYQSDGSNLNTNYLIYPDVLKEYNGPITNKLVNKYGKCSRFKYYFTSIIYNRKKITLKKLLKNIEGMIKFKMEYHKNNK